MFDFMLAIQRLIDVRAPLSCLNPQGFLISHRSSVTRADIQEQIQQVSVRRCYVSKHGGIVKRRSESTNLKADGLSWAWPM